MTRALLAVVAAAVVGCASGAGTKIQTSCEQSHSRFPDVVECTRGRLVEQYPQKLQDQKVKLYLLRGEQLAEDVRAGRASDVDAKVAWQRMYVELWEPSPAERAAARQAAAAAQQRQAEEAATSGYTIVQPAPTTHTVCTSQNLPGGTQTNCASR